MTAMTDQEINAAIAEGCGWENVKEAVSFDGTHLIVGDVPGLCQDITKEIPNYCTDLNAMHEAEKMLTCEHNKYLNALKRVIDFSAIEKSYDLSTWELTTATARQRAEAFLRTKGLWRE